MFNVPRYYKCSKYNQHFCTGSIKKLADGFIQTISPHTNHEPSERANSRQIILTFKDVLKQRAIMENNILKNIYDEEARR